MVPKDNGWKYDLQSCQDSNQFFFRKGHIQTIFSKFRISSTVATNLILTLFTCPGHKPTTRENTIIMSKWVTQGQAEGKMDHFSTGWAAFEVLLKIAAFELSWKLLFERRMPI